MITNWVAPMSCVGVVAAIATAGRISVQEGLWVAAAVLLAFGPSALQTTSAVRRRFAESLLIPLALVLMIYDAPAQRMMLACPVLLLAAWAAWHAAVRSGDCFFSAPALTAFFGLSLRVMTGGALASGGVHGVVAALVAAVVVPFAAARLSPKLGLMSVLIFAAIPFQYEPWSAWALTAIAAGSLLMPIRSDVAGPCDELSGGVSGVLPLLGAAACIGLAVAPWGSLSPTALWPSASWVSWAALAVAIVVAFRVPTASAAACTVFAVLLLGPAQPRIPGFGAKTLTADEPARVLRVGDGKPYGIDLALRHGAGLRDNVTVAWVHLDEKKVPIRVGRNIVEESHRRRNGHDEPQHSEPAAVICRPPSAPGQGWNVCARTMLKAPAGVRPVIRRNPKIRDTAVVKIVTAGPRRNESFFAGIDGWVLLGLFLVPLVQLVSGSWLRRSAWLPWLPLVVGLMVARVAVEPLHRLGAHLQWTLCAAAVVAALVPVVRSRFGVTSSES